MDIYQAGFPNRKPACSFLIADIKQVTKLTVAIFHVIDFPDTDTGSSNNPALYSQGYFTWRRFCPECRRLSN